MGRRASTPASKRSTKPKTPPAPPAEVPATLPEGVETPNGVIIVREVGDDGNIGVQVRALGDVKITEIDTILKLAGKQVREALEL